MPLARFAAEHVAELGTPLKRYHIATVWRGEKPQAGRYREFMQCDFDTVGTQAIAADIETVLVIDDLLRAIGIQDFTIRLNNRKVLTGMLQRFGLAEHTADVLRSLDKLAKLGPERVSEEMQSQAGASAAQAAEILRLSQIQGSNEDVLRQVEALVAASDEGRQGVAHFQEILAAASAVGIPAERLRLDVSIARGLDYYTGTVFETFLDALPGIGSICSGGRYDNLAELYTNQPLPGIGASLGLDRLLTAMEELGLVEKVATPAPVFIPFFDKNHLHDYLRLAAALRRAGIGVEVLSRAEEARAAAQVRRPPRFPHCTDRRGERIPSRHLSDQGPATGDQAGCSAGAGCEERDRRGARDTHAMK